MLMKQLFINFFLKFTCGNLLPVLIALIALLTVLIPYRGVTQVLPRVEDLLNQADELRNTNPDKAMQLAIMAMNEARSVNHVPSIARVYRFTGVLNFMTGDLETAARQFDSAIILYERLKDDKGIAASLNNLGVIYQERGDYPRAIDCFDESVRIKLDLGDTAGATSGMINTGTIYSYMGNNGKALQIFGDVLRIASENRDTARIIDVKINMGTVFINDKMPAKALEILLEAASLSKITMDNYSLAYCYNNIGGVYQNTRQDVKAINYFSQALALRDDLGDVAGMATTLDNLGKMYTRLGEYDTALGYFFQALKNNQLIEDKRSTAICLNSIGELLMKKQDFNGAIGYFSKAATIARDLTLRQEIRVMYANTMLSYAALGQFDSAQVYLTQYNSTADSSWYTAINAEKAIAAQQHTGQNLLFSNKTGFYLLAGLLVFFIMFSILLFVRLRIFKKRAMDLISRQRRL